MKQCPNCKNQVDDNATFCTVCGAQFASEQPQQGQAQQQQGQPQQGFNQNQGAYNNMPPQGYAPQYDPYDHTAEFDAKDISDNKVLAMMVYLLGIVGIIVAMLGRKDSPYAAFHVRQGMKFVVVDALVAICAAVLCWTCIVPIAAAILEVVLLVVKIICVFQVGSGKAKEPVIIRSLGFLK